MGRMETKRNNSSSEAHASSFPITKPKEERPKNKQQLKAAAVKPSQNISSVQTAFGDVASRLQVVTDCKVFSCKHQKQSLFLKLC